MKGPVESAGGPFLLMAASVASAWRGAQDRPAYERVCRGPDEGRVIVVADRDAVVLGTPDAAYWLPLADGGVVARVVSFDADDPELLEAHLAALPDTGWRVLGAITVLDGALVLFDAALAGDDGDALALDVAPGRYDVSTRTANPDGGTELLLTRLRRHVPETG